MEQETKEKDTNQENRSIDWDFWGQAFVWVVIIVAAILLRPSESTHRDKIMDELRVSAKKELKKEGNKALKKGDYLMYGADKAAMKKEEALDALIEDKFSIDINSYLVLSLGKVKESETGETKTVSIGIFGFVLVKDIPFNW